MAPIPELPGEMIRNVLVAALASLPPTNDHSNERRDLLLATSLVSKSWGSEAQRLLFFTESIFFNRLAIEIWVQSAPRFAISSVTLDSQDFELDDLRAALDGCTSANLKNLEIKMGMIPTEALVHRELGGIKSLSLYMEVSDHRLSSPISSQDRLHVPTFDLDFLQVRVDVNYNAEITHHIFRTLKSLEPCITKASCIRIVTAVESSPPAAEEALALALADLVKASSATLKTLELDTEHHPYLNSAFSTLESLEEIVDGARGSRQEKVDRILALPATVKRYYPAGNDHEDTVSLLQSLGKLLLSRDDFLPALETTSGKWMLELDQELEELWKQVETRRPLLSSNKASGRN